MIPRPAQQPMTCYVCKQPIVVGDYYVRDPATLCAAHPKCQPERKPDSLAHTLLTRYK